MKIFGRFSLVFTVVFCAAALVSCSAERNNKYDPGADNYVGDKDNDNYTPGWQGAQKIDNGLNQSNYGWSDKPRISMGSNGTAFVIWRQEVLDDSSKHHIFTNQLKIGGNWESPRQIDSGDYGWERDCPAITVNDNDEAFAAWIEDDGNGTKRIVCNGYDNENWESTVGLFTVNQYSGNVNNSLSNVKIAMSDYHDRCVITYNYYDDSTTTDSIEAWAYNGSEASKWQSRSWIIDPMNVNDQQLSMSSDYGFAIYVPSADSNSLNEAYIYFNDFNTGWSTAADQIFDGGAADYPHSPAIARDSSGYAIAAWICGTGVDDYDGDIYVNQNNKIPSDDWNTSNVYNLRNLGDTFAKPKIVMNSQSDSSNVMVVYRDFDGNIDTQRYVNGSGWNIDSWGGIDSFTTIRQSGGDLQGFDIAMDGAGNCIAVWSAEENPGYYRIYATRYDVGSNSWDPAQMIDVNTGVNAGDLNQVGPRIGMDQNGNAVVVWVEGDQIFANIYRSN